MGNMFGTDGIRGVANRDLSPELAFTIGRIGAYVLTRETGLNSIVIGRDTRLSGDMLEAALIAGICSVGVNVLRVGVIPTPGVAFLTRELNAGAGIVISASHNPCEDNGIKFFGANGFKLPDAVEERIENAVLNAEECPSPTGAGIGRVFDATGAVGRYVEHAKTTGPRSLAGLKIVVDCANGAAFEVAPRLLEELGAEVIPLNCRPDGTNINLNCGSTHPEPLQDKVVAAGADLGLAYDGDADRVIAVDHRGRLVDGDHIMVICGLHLKEQGLLPGNKIVVTVMSNLGLHLALREAGIEVLQTKVGDRYVLEEMLRAGIKLGGEQSGHIIFLDYNTTGDGIITTMQLLKVMEATGCSLADLASRMQRLPQMLKNVRVQDKKRIMVHPALVKAIEAHEAVMKGEGRILVRPSGTEPLVRVMAECRDEDMLDRIVDDLVEIIRRVDEGGVA
ncbi:MAG: phosphoglucosamine mutase [Peptococcaceae bacterium]|nr:phosphoglucosamine mutase [Peptococcaceae bacterium]